MSFMSWAIALLIVVGAAIGAVVWYNKKQHDEQIAEEEAIVKAQKEDVRRSLLSQALLAKSDIDDAILLLKTNKGSSKDLHEEMAQLKSLALDAIEILSEEGDYEESTIHRFISDAANGVRYVNRMHDK